jgi:spermidine/putrescine-binding protein
MMRPQRLALGVGVGAIALTAAWAGLASGKTNSARSVRSQARSASSLPVPRQIAHPPAALTTRPKVKPKYITIRVWSGPYETVFMKSAGAAFTKATGVKIRWDTTDEVISYQKIDQEEAAHQRPEADASMQAQQRAYVDAVRGWTLPISAKVAPNMLKAVPAVAMPGGTPRGATTWAYVNPYTVTVTFVVNPKKINPASVQHWRDLSSPKLRHQIVFDQTFSTTAFPLARALGIDPAKNPPHSLDRVWSFIRKLRPNLAAIGNGQDVTTALTSGHANLGVTCACNIIGAGPAAEKLKIVPPVDGMGLVADGYYIHKGIPAANYYYAELFANYLFAKPTQKAFPQAGLVPDVPGTPVPAYMKKQPRAFPLTAAEINKAHGVVYPFPLIARYNAQWQSDFEAALK